MTMPAERDASGRTRTPIDRIGVTVLNELVQSIVTGEFTPGDALPPESVISVQFGVSRTVIRETMKRLQEKGMVTVAQGRGTHVTPSTSWNVLDPLVLSTMIRNDSTLGVLDDLSVVRGALEAAMAAAAAKSVDDEGRTRLRESLEAMAERVEDSAAFREADVRFHLAVMELSENGLAENISRVLIAHAVGSDRFTGQDPAHAFELTLAEHEKIVEAISAGDPEAARVAMSEHILGSWERRRLPSERHPD
ncbi:FadR/GntR family transcriptional regulator [Microbacterium sp. CIAB417]|uniref:FadR/GntR family transcriptional regulator n=1 Tax=Microbacterium sp. CIAB417 TaxID=2860287 RepID=UPI001FAE08B1|nr:FadR/GntR family transcriptional regulator [Microbacterium sp. CIAB417]